MNLATASLPAILDAFCSLAALGASLLRSHTFLMRTLSYCIRVALLIRKWLFSSLNSGAVLRLALTAAPVGDRYGGRG